MIRAFIIERPGCPCWYCSRQRALRLKRVVSKPVVVPVEPSWRPADRSAS